MNIQILRTLEALRDWANPKCAGMFIRNAIAAARFDDRRERRVKVEWEPIDPSSPIGALLVQIPLHKWPIPKNHGRFHPFCDHMVTDQQSCHLQRAHERKRVVPTEDSTVKRVWNGESTLQATTADLLNIWSIAHQGAKYANAYARTEERKVATFKALAETWKLPEVKLWNKHLGDFWGPIMIFLRHSRNWMSIHEALNTGFEHSFIGKTDEEVVEAWGRGECEAIEDSQGIFKDIVSEVRPACGRDGHVVSPGLWRQLNVADREMQLAVPLELNEEAEWASLPLDPGKGMETVPQWCADMESLINRNREEIIEYTVRACQNLQGKLENMTERMKAMWTHATNDQKADWLEMKKQTFGNTELHTELLDLICSFESRWIPHEHCACPICWEEGQTQKFSDLPDFVNHMKGTHHIGWKNVKDH
jgi:hypothetical protein